MATAKSAIHDIGVASQIGKYSDAIEVSHPSRLLFIIEIEALAAAPWPAASRRE